MIAKVTGAVLPKVVKMSMKRSYLVILLLMIGCQQAGIGQDKPAQLANGKGSAVEIDTQLQLNKEALISKGSSEQMRINAANLLLFSGNPLARQILLDVLRQTENNPARVAVCKALAQTRAARKSIENKDDFAEPLFDILTNGNSAMAKLAAEATLIFEYGHISERLEEIASKGPLSARLNAVYALRLHPDIRAAIKLLGLLDDSEGQVAAAAESALRSLGIPTGQDRESRKEIVGELKREGLGAFLRDRLIQQEAEMRKLEAELNLWRQRYLSEVDKRYDAISDDAAKDKFLAEHLSGTDTIVKLWALDELRQRRTGSIKLKLSVELEDILIGLISDRTREVRLNTANLLSLMGELNSAQRLLEQLNIEEDDEVRLELFVALGEACFYASLPDAVTKVPNEVRKQALDWAAKYLSEQEPRKARKGADVVRKLLEQDGLTADEVDRYLGLLAEKYKQQQNEADGTLRAELLSAMAGLCAERSVCRAQAVKRFRLLFDEALKDDKGLVRQAAVEGLIYIDKAGALQKLRKGFVDDPSDIIRRLIDLAGEVGGQEDLVWLAEKMGRTGENEPAWQAMLKIFERSGAAVINEWLAKFDSENTQSRFSDEQRIAFFEIAAEKLTTEDQPRMVNNIRLQLARLYSKSGRYQQAAGYFGLLHGAAQTVEEKQAIVPDLLDAFLRWPNLKSAVDLVANCLLEKDLDPNSAVVSVIDNYLSKPPAEVDPRAVLDALSQIETGEPEARAMWRKQLERWADKVGAATGSEERKETGS
jgi:hypothetical protein